MKFTKVTIKKRRAKKSKVNLIKLCHYCNKINESTRELQRCNHCTKSFMPLNYLLQMKEQNSTKFFNELYNECKDLNDEDLIKGLYLIWES